jgi:hypothetical protein
MTAFPSAARGAALLWATAPLYGLSFPLAAQTTPGAPPGQVAPAAGPTSPTPAAESSGWSDIGLWGVIGLVVAAAIVIVFVMGRKRRPR